MQLSPLTIESIADFITGDNRLTPYLSGQQLIGVFNNVGFRDVYNHSSGGGLPNSLSRKYFTNKRLNELNGKKELKALLEIIFDSRNFAKAPEKEIAIAIEKVNLVLIHDGYKFEKIDERYKIIGDDLPEEIQVEIHFEEIQAQLIENIKSAKYLIWVAVAWFTDKVLFDLLVQKRREGANVQIVILDNQINNESFLNFESYFETYRIKQEGNYGNIMHHKFCILDLKTVIHGSYNWTNKARNNKETITIDNSREIADKFAEEFIKLKRGNE